MQSCANELAAMRTAFELVREPVFVIDAHVERIVAANPAACRSVGIEQSKLIGRLWHQTFRPAKETTIREVGGRWFVAIDHLSANSDAGTAHVLRDALTGLATRDALPAFTRVDDQNEALRQLGVLFVDLDGFKQINDNCGHIAGDHVLRIVSQRLSSSVRRSDLVVRFGGDEFLVVVRSTSRRRELCRLRRRISRRIQRPITVAGYEIVVSASIGVAEDTSHAPCIERLIAAADRAMYQAKARRSYVSEFSHSRIDGRLGRRSAK